MFHIAEPHHDGTVEVTFSVLERNVDVEVILDIDFLLHPAWPSLDHLVLRPEGHDSERRSLTVRLPADVELSYRYLRRHRGDTRSADAASLDALRNLVATGQPDPDVEAQIDDAFGSGTTASVLRLPLAHSPHSVWLSSAEQEERPRTISVHTTGRSTTLILPREMPRRLALMVDGDVWLNSLGITTAATRWHAQRDKSGSAPTAIAVIPTPERETLAERETMSELVISDIVPACEAALGTAFSAPDIAIIGQSYGGLAAAGIAVDHPERVGTAIMSSGSFWFTPEHDARDAIAPGALTEELKSDSTRRLAHSRFFLHVGREEGTMVDHSRMFAEAARGAGADADLLIHPGGHDYAWYRHATFHSLDSW